MGSAISVAVRLINYNLLEQVIKLQQLQTHKSASGDQMRAVKLTSCIEPLWKPSHLMPSSLLLFVLSVSVLSAAPMVNAGFHGHQVQTFPPHNRIWLLQRKPDLSPWHFVTVSSLGSVYLSTLTAYRTQGGMKLETPTPPIYILLSVEIYSISLSLFVNWY